LSHGRPILPAARNVAQGVTGHNPLNITSLGQPLGATENAGVENVALDDKGGKRGTAGVSDSDQ